MPDVMYSELASWWPLLSSPKDYEEEAGFYTYFLKKACKPRTVLELGSGGGNNASHMKRDFQLTLMDRSPDMLAVSRELNPECEHVQGDMRTARFGREYDAVFLHDAVMYMATREDLFQALQTARVHCRRGGAVVIAPDFTAETFRPGTEHGGHDAPGRSLRYLEWVRDPDPNDERVTVDYVFALREEGKPLRVVHETQDEGLFSAATWIDLCHRAGLKARLEMVHHTGVGETPVFICSKI